MQRIQRHLQTGNHRQSWSWAGWHKHTTRGSLSRPKWRIQHWHWSQSLPARKGSFACSPNETLVNKTARNLSLVYLLSCVLRLCFNSLCFFFLDSFFPFFLEFACSLLSLFFWKNFPAPVSCRLVLGFFCSEHVPGVHLLIFVLCLSFLLEEPGGAILVSLDLDCEAKCLKEARPAKTKAAISSHHPGLTMQRHRCVLRFKNGRFQKWLCYISSCICKI